MMNKLMLIQQQFCRDEQGVTSIEYAFLASLIAMVIVLAVAALGKQLCGIFQNVGEMIGGAASNGNAPC